MRECFESTFCCKSSRNKKWPLRQLTLHGRCYERETHFKTKNQDDWDMCETWRTKIEDSFCERYTSMKALRWFALSRVRLTLSYKCIPAS